MTTIEINPVRNDDGTCTFWVDSRVAGELSAAEPFGSRSEALAYVVRLAKG